MRMWLKMSLMRQILCRTPSDLAIAASPRFMEFKSHSAT